MTNQLFCVIALFLFALESPKVAGEEVLRVGIIGCDTSHVIAFTRLINDPEASGALARMRVASAYPGGSDDIPSSRDRVAGFTKQLNEEFDVEILPSIQAVVEASDAILLESVDGRVHLEQFRQAAIGKPVFIDKPVAASLAETIKIFKLAQETNTPCFTASGLRFCTNVQELLKDESLGEIVGAATASPYRLEPHHPDFFWYGIHGIESLLTIMGTGCEEVVAVESASAAVVTGRWKDGRLGTYRGIREGHADYTATIYGSKRIDHRSGFGGYGLLVENIAEFFLSGEPPVSKEQMIEVVAFMEAADESKQNGSRPVKLETIIERARRQVEKSRNTNHR